MYIYTFNRSEMLDRNPTELSYIRIGICQKTVGTVNYRAYGGWLRNPASPIGW